LKETQTGEQKLMNCQKTRESIDAGISKAVFASHLANCSACESYSKELSSLLSLLREQPRVEAPADFDFRLKARIARAQAAQVAELDSSMVPGWVSRLWSGSFSWVQATAATAAVALVVSVSTYQIYQNNQVAPAIAPATPFVAMNNGTGGVENQFASVKSTAPSAPRSERPAAARQARPTGQRTIAVETAPTPIVEPLSGASSMTIFNGEQGRMISTSSQMMLIGAEGSTGGSTSSSRGLGYVPSI
jgi:hypothetical protein